MWRRCVRLTAVTLMAAAACAPRRDPIVVNGSIVTIENQTSHEWSNVVVTVNDHFRGGARTLAAGQLLTAPLSQFQTAFGQRFAIGRQTVFKIEVTATDARGQPVTLEWGSSPRAR